MNPLSYFQITLSERKMLTEETFVLHCSRPPEFVFTAGQYVSLKVLGEERCYSIISGEDAESLSFLIKRIKGGKVSSALHEILLPIQVEMGLAEGYFIPKSTTRKNIFVATGTGIAPFISMIRSGITPYLLLQGAAKPEELYFEKELSSRVDNYHRYLSRSPPPRQESASCIYSGYITDYLHEHLPEDIYDFYLCGRWKMIRDAIHLIDDKFPKANIYSEGFD